MIESPQHKSVPVARLLVSVLIQSQDLNKCPQHTGSTDSHLSLVRYPHLTDSLALSFMVL